MYDKYRNIKGHYFEKKKPRYARCKVTGHIVVAQSQQ